MNQSCSCWPTPQPQPRPQQHWIPAASTTYTTACGNTRSLTHCAGAGDPTPLQRASQHSRDATEPTVPQGELPQESSSNEPAPAHRLPWLSRALRTKPDLLYLASKAPPPLPPPGLQTEYLTHPDKMFGSRALAGGRLHLT